MAYWLIISAFCAPVIVQGFLEVLVNRFGEQ
jgi:hypothetical protein